jgi:hypothetical protein
MTDDRDDRLVGEHYGRGDLAKRILEALRAAGKDPDALNVEDLAPVDQLHTYCKKATLDLARRAGITAGCGCSTSAEALADRPVPSRACSVVRWRCSTSRRSSAAPGRRSPPRPA